MVSDVVELHAMAPHGYATLVMLKSGKLYGRVLATALDAYIVPYENAV